jgi:probable rRNA maturation factor
MENNFLEVYYQNIESNSEYENLIRGVVNMCFKVENLEKLNLYISITLTTPAVIRKINKEYRDIDKETDVLSFPMFEKNELDEMVKEQNNQIPETIGDIVISVERVEEQAKEYGHSFERELAYMVVHGFYHLMGYDHMVEDDKKIMREKEEHVLSLLEINR